MTCMRRWPSSRRWSTSLAWTPVLPAMMPPLPAGSQSSRNASAVEGEAGLAIAEGRAIFDLFEDITGAAFVAERYLWNTTEAGTWIDLTPRPENVSELLLVEAQSLPDGMPLLKQRSSRPRGCRP